jgi:hypothetical protein
MSSSPSHPAGAREVVAMRRILAFIAVALLVFFIVTQPEAAADAVRTIGAAVVDFFDAIVTFLSELL